MSAALRLAEGASAAQAKPGTDIALSGVQQRFGARTVLRGIDLDIPAGQFVAVIGRSGCGKSTLLRIMAGLDAASAGSVWFSAGQARTRLMFQEPRLLPWARIGENVAVGLGPGRHSAAERARVQETLAAVGLAARAGEWPSMLSGGQKQRVALARALVSRPCFLALDEPLGALDALTRIEMQGLLEAVWQAQGFTAVLVTHDVAEALVLADRVVMIEDGRVSLDIAVDLPRPRRRGAAGFGALEEDILARLLRPEA